MKPARFEYHAPETLAQCLALLAEHGDESAVLAGGQSLLPLMRFRLAQPAHLISLRGLGGPLERIERRGGSLYIGARVTYTAVQRSAEVREGCPGLPRSIELIATPAVRTRGTVCGNLCQADPASELPAVALLLEARMHLHSAEGTRVVAAADFFQGPYMTARRGNELLVAVEFPVRPATERFAIREITRLRGGFPMSGVAVALTPGAGSALESVAVACFGVHSQQLRLHAVEQVLRQRGRTPAALQAAGEALDAAIHPHSDPFASEAYRRSATRTLLERVLAEACAQPSNPP
ncbi:FAD binding domain-containing protein [Xenophilus azovorans]|uniref:FAD binding domain-containing protein n=1 Tax=Xenophilus azovorans TaxID=151755 RepID=UPI00056E8265|nr:xanthine dehydrogenase family protein subunit M [Xenophilus azovorans]